ncbi:unnamed protein product [Moneuplotes crassus]|uniref:Uncharacterized protein n=1 Tax=Euplotes crassus TaxID=5936 RepID=A0AAD1UDJ0_EUPCR|nr:unnamed protein product [Moneuplotes crassus]
MEPLAPKSGDDQVDEDSLIKDYEASKQDADTQVSRKNKNRTETLTFASGRPRKNGYAINRETYEKSKETEKEKEQKNGYNRFKNYRDMIKTQSNIRKPMSTNNEVSHLIICFERPNQSPMRTLLLIGVIKAVLYFPSGDKKTRSYLSFLSKVCSQSHCKQHYQQESFRKIENFSKNLIGCIKILLYFGVQDLIEIITSRVQMLRLEKNSKLSENDPLHSALDVTSLGIPIKNVRILGTKECLCTKGNKVVKHCPKCKSIIEKNKGCDVMNCKVCGETFGWRLVDKKEKYSPSKGKLPEDNSLCARFSKGFLTVIFPMTLVYLNFKEIKRNCRRRRSLRCLGYTLLVPLSLLFALIYSPVFMVLILLIFFGLCLLKCFSCCKKKDQKV